MAIASLALRTSNFTSTQSSCELRTTAGVPCKVLEVSMVQATATAQTLGIGRPNAVGVTPATTSTFQRDDPNHPACVTTISLTWGTSPTAPLNYFRRWNSAATIGVGMIFTFPRGLSVNVSSSLVVQNISTAVATDVNFAIDE
jgi:hypothetical protein